jgi:DNA helicase-2/ATP-dependent DNA helicase PcrA
VAFRRAIATPARGIGRATVARLELAAAERGEALLAAAAAEPVGGGRGARALEEFAALGQRLGELAAGPAPLADRVNALVEASGLRAALRREETSEAASRLENLDELVTAAAEFAARSGSQDVAAFLDAVTLIADVDELAEPRAAATLMTLHSAKGLEFPVVFLTGLEEGVFPHARALDDEDAVEEERRLAYVGVTRAKTRLFLSHALQRRLGGFAGLREPSRFLLEMPPAALTLVGAGSRPGRWPLDPGGLVREPEPDDAADYPMRVGARVRHAGWGEGRLIGIERDGADFVVTVNFAAVGKKRLALKYAPLEEL